MKTEHLGKTLHQLGTMNQTQVNLRLKKLDLSMTQGIALIWLEETPDHELPIKTLEKMFETAQPTTLGVINRLEQKNLVTTHLSGKRKKIVKITENGLNIVEDIKECIEEVEALFFRNFTIGEHAIFMELLQKAKNNILQYQAIKKEETENEE